MMWQLPAAGDDAGLPDQTLVQAAFASAGTGIYLTDRAGHITAANPQAGVLLRRPMAGMLGADAHDLLHRARDGGRVHRSSCALMGVLEDRRMARGEAAFLRSDGSLLPVFWSAAPIRQGEQIRGVVVVFVDFTERLNLSRQQADHLAALEDFTARLTLVTEITSVLTQTLDVDEALHRLGRLIVPRLADWAVVNLRLDHDEGDRVVVVPAAEGAQGSAGLSLLFGQPSSPLAARVLDRGETVLLGPDDVGTENSGLLPEERELFAARGASSVISTPVRTPRQVLGALTVARTDPAHPFDSTEPEAHQRRDRPTHTVWRNRRRRPPRGTPSHAEGRRLITYGSGLGPGTQWIHPGSGRRLERRRRLGRWSPSGGSA
ncbi:PAS domain-containing protein [Microbispora hainanensis]|uniref:PAS domain-containing protein n=1 Tax=Microbispora hainanensis TaxID=568844 RepID=UPI0033E80C8B